MKKLLAWLLVCILTLTTLSAAWAETTGEETPAEETPQSTYDYDQLTVAVTTPLTGNFFTNMWGNGSSDMDVRSMIHGYNLVEWDTEVGGFVPNPSVISGITVQNGNNGNKTFIISLYNDLYYSDGTRITAWDYAFSMLLSMAPEMEKLGAAVKKPEYIAGYDRYMKGRTYCLTGIRVITNHMLHITIDRNYLPFFFELGLLDCQPYPISEIAPGVKVADDGEGIYLTNADAANKTPVFTADLLKETILDEETGYRSHPSVSCGPYKLISYGNGVAEFEINDQYKGDSKGVKPTIRKVVFGSLASDKMAQAFRDGTVTVLNKVSDAKVIAECLDLTEEQGNLTSASYPRNGMSFISFNADRAPLDDVRVRQAIAYLADRDTIAKEVLGDYGMRALGYFGMGQWMYLLLSGAVSPTQEPGENADAKTIAEYNAAVKKWSTLSLDSIEKYDLNTDKGAELLNAAGWNLNENGEAFVPGQDKLRYRKTADGLVPLQLTLAYAEGSAVSASLEGTLVQNMADAGIELKVEAIAADDLFSQYYRLADGRYDMYFLATNFDVLYDPSLSFTEPANGHHVWKTSGLEDNQLWRLAVDMRKTTPGDLLEYCTEWLKFQKRLMEQLPVLPMYSNMYYDFYPETLQDYSIADYISWPQAIVGSSMTIAIPEPETDADPE